MEGAKLTYNPDQDDIIQMQMYGFIRNENNAVRITNRIFEIRLYNLFLSDEELESNVFSKEGELAKNRFIKDGREQFLLYLRPIINGTGNYYSYFPHPKVG